MNPEKEKAPGNGRSNLVVEQHSKYFCNRLPQKYNDNAESQVLNSNLGIYTSIDTRTGEITCHGETVTRKGRYRVNGKYVYYKTIEVLCPFCFNKNGDWNFHEHGYSDGITRRMSHCHPPYEGGDYFITAEDNA